MGAIDMFEEQKTQYDATSFPAPRDFQAAAHIALRQGVKDGHRAQMLMAPTGAGKTYLGLRVSSEALAKGRRALFLCDRITLINQTSTTADCYGLSAHGILQARHWRHNPDHAFQIASVQTIGSRGQWPFANVVIVDEAHTQLSVVTDYIESFKDKPITEGPLFIGLSATPFSRGLGKLYTNLVNAATMHDLVEQGVLVPFRALSCTKADMREAATAGGEWTKDAAAERGLAIVGDVVTEWVRYAEGRKTIVFGATIAHCEELCKKFNESGIMAEVFCATTTDTQRDNILKEYRKRDSFIRVLISVEALAKGFDVPDVGCVVDCRPLRKSLSTFVQMLGRGLRASPETGKTDCLLLDHSGNIVRFAKDFEDIYFNGLEALDSGEKYDSSIRKDEEDDKRPGCPKCGYRPFLKRCMSCGYEKPAAPTIEHEVSSGMREIVIGGKKMADNRRDLWQQICSYTKSHGNPLTAEGRAGHIYKDLMGAFPSADGGYMSFRDAPIVPITKPVRDQILRRRIAFVKGKR